MSAERTACSQFNQHAWKKDVCTNCSKPLSCHSSAGTFKSSPLKTNINPVVNAANVSSEGCAGDTAKSSTKPSKPKKPPLVQSEAPKCLTNEKEINITKVNDSKTNLDQDLSLNFSFDKSKGSSNYYQIYDVAAKGQSGKPLDIDSRNDDSSYERDLESSNACLMATPYTVVDVITMALEKSRQSSMTGSNPPCLPSTPAPDIKKNLSKKSDLANFKKEESRHPTEDEIKEKDSEEDSSHNFRPRLYEEIDDSFLEKVASKKLDINQCDVNACQLLNEENKTVVTKSVELADNKLPELNHKPVSKQEKSKKSGSKSFFQKLLGKGNKEEESCKVKVEKNGKKESSVDGKSLASSEEDAQKSSESLLSDVQFRREVEVDGSALESSSVPEMLSQSTCIGEDFAKEIEEKFETLSRKSNLNKSALMRSISNKVEDPFNSGENLRLTSPTLENVSSLDEGVATLPSRKSVLMQTTKKVDSLNNRKSMTPAEAKLARKMLVAPPPPPICTSSTSLASTSSHSASKDDISSCPIKKPSNFMSLQRKPDFTNVLVAPQSTSEDVFESSEIMNRDSLMDDLDEILKRGGMAQGAANTLPKSFLHSHDKTNGSLKLTPGHISSKEINVPSGNAVQQRALPDLPQLPPPTARLHKANLSPESENVYEILPHSEDIAPKKLNFVVTKSEKPPSRSSIKFDEIINASQSFKCDQSKCQTSNRPRPAPRAAIRAVCMTKTKDVDASLKTPEESYENANENTIFNKATSIESLRLDETFEEKCSIFSNTAVKSLQIYLDKFCTPVPLISLTFNLSSIITWTKREVEVIRAAECKSSVLSWNKAVFYEVTIDNMNCIVMIRRSSIITSPLPKFDHMNLMNSLHSFEAQAELPDCMKFFQTTNEQGRVTGKEKYIFDILPYSKILAFPLVSQHFANSSKESYLVCNDVSKYKVYILLQVFDSLLHLQRLGIDLYRLYPSDILLVAPIHSTTSSSCAHENESYLLPILVPTEYTEQSQRSDQKLLCHDLAKIAGLIMSSTNTPKDVSSISKQTDGEKVCQMQTRLPQPRARHTSISLDKNDRCMRKVERIMSTSDSWHQIEIVKNYLELSLWGPTSEEEVRLALTSPQRRQIFDMWLGLARSDILVSLMENTHPQVPSIGMSKPAKSYQNDNTRKSHNQELIAEFTSTFWHAAMETMRKAEFLAKCDLETLLVSAKELFF